MQEDTGWAALAGTLPGPLAQAGLLHAIPT